MGRYLILVKKGPMTRMLWGALCSVDYGKTMAFTVLLIAEYFFSFKV